MPSAPAVCWGWGWEKAGKNISICPFSITTIFSQSSAKSYWIALHAADRFSTVLAAGLVTLIAVQTVLNLCVVTNLLPSTGIALPFFSYGGTALAVNLGEMGIVLGISRYRNQAKKLEDFL